MQMKVLLLLLLGLSIPGTDAFGSLPGRRIVSADSARILSPAAPMVLRGRSAIVEVKPLCPVEAVELLVGYYPRRYDTLARLSEPPFAVTWHFAGLPDQDQLHLQFGYVLYHPGGDTIVSPPLPNNWVIDRDGESSPRRYVCRRAAADSSIVIDGDLGEWKRFPAEALGKGRGRFGCAWTAAHLFVAVEVRDSAVTVYDHVEVMTDPKQLGGSLAGIDHRILSFGPMSRSFVWAVEPGSGGGHRTDSVIVRVQDETVWRSVRTAEGYLVEAKIPFCVLSDLEFPRRRMGFELCVVDGEARRGEPTVVSWAGSHPAARHNPSEWGTVVFRQRMPALKALLVLMGGIGLGIIALVVALGIRGAYRDRRFERRAGRGYPRQVRRILACIDEHHTAPEFDITKISRHTGMTRDEIREVLVNELETGCERLIEQARVRSAKQTLRTSDASLSDVARTVGFADESSFITAFCSLAGLPPDQWREVRRSEEAEDEDRGVPAPQDDR